MIEIGTDFSGVGAFEQALIRLDIEYQTIFACEIDKYARETYIANYGVPGYFPFDVYDRIIPKKPLDVYMTAPPCQSFSIAGKRKGQDDDRGILFYNSHKFIKNNKPRYFIFENVKGLLSDDKKNPKDEIGRTFRCWLDYLGGKSVNGDSVIFPHEESLDYHIYWKVLNAKDYGVPQNRERVFIIGIRDDVDNYFHFPKKQHLTKRLKDVLEMDVDKKYYLSDKLIKGFLAHKERHEEKGTGFKWKPKKDDDIGNTLRASVGFAPTDNSIIVKSATKKGYETAKEGDSINFSVPNSETRRGRVGKGVAQTLDTACNQGIIIKTQFGKHQQDCFYDSNGIIGAIPAGTHGSTPHLTKTLIPCGTKIRRLTPRECFRLMDFPDSFIMPCSDTQMYKQAGNSIVVAVLEKILDKLFLYNKK